MHNDSTTENVNDAEFPETGAAPNVDSVPGPAESGAPAPADRLAARGVEVPSMSSAAGDLPTPSIIPARVAVSANSVTSDSKDGAGAERQFSAVPSKASENNLLPIAGEPVTEPGEGDDGGCLGLSPPGPRIPRTP